MGKPKDRPKSWKELSATFKREHLADDWQPPFIVFQWVCEWASYWLGRLALLEVLEYVGKLGILIAAVTYIYPGCTERKQAAEDSKKSRHYIAWQTLNSAVGKPGNAGRVDALEDLNADGVSLANLNLTAAKLSNVSLLHSDLSKAIFTSTELTHVNFSDAKLDGAVFEEMTCRACSFSNAALNQAYFFHTRFVGCDFSSTSFEYAHFDDAVFIYCDFSKANLEIPRFATNSAFVGCNFNSARISCFIDFWKSVSFFASDFENITNRSGDWNFFLEMAKKTGGVVAPTPKWRLWLDKEKPVSGSTYDLMGEENDYLKEITGIKK